MDSREALSSRVQRRVRLHRVVNDETYAALALAAATVAALVWANIGTSYESFWAIPAGFSLGAFDFRLDLHAWVDEGIMAAFFFMVGLDVRRELSIGELKERQRAVLPVAAAVGGLIVPAALFLLVTHGQGYAHAWGSVISTDTAFALGMLALIGPRNAPRLRVFLLALAVVDDLGALSVIAIFYTEDLRLGALALAAVGLLGVWLLQRAHVWRFTPYAVLGLGIWACVYAAGVHATLAGVLIALLMPVYPPRRRDVRLASIAFHLFRQAPQPNTARMVRDAIAYSVPLNQRLSAVLPPYVNLIVVPLFALSNAGVALSGDSLATAFTSSLTWGVIAGLVVGKLIGITAASALVLRLVPGSRLPGLDLPRIAGVGALAGMGFTISLLVVGLAIEDQALADQARIGVLSASVLALILATAIFRIGDRAAPLDPPAGEHLTRAVDPERDHVRGRPDAPATIVVYAALDEAYRHDTALALAETARALGDDLRIVFRHFTRTDEQRTAALALEAAGAQGRFWEMHDALTRRREPIDTDAVLSVAAQLGIDTDELSDRIARCEDEQRVEDDDLDLEGAEITGSSVLYLDGERFTAPANSLALSTRVRRRLDG